MLDDPNPWHASDGPSSVDDGHQSSRRGCLPGCLLSGCIALIIILVVGGGVGFPNTYWHRIGYVQVFEGPDRVVLFVEVQRAMKWPGLLSRPPHNFAAEFLRINVFADGRVERTALPFDFKGHITFNTNLYAVVRLADGFYLVEKPSYAPRPCYRLGQGWVEPLPPEEVIRALGNDVLRAGGNVFDLSELDEISARRGWRRLNHEQNGPYLLHSDPVDSTRHGVRLQHAGGWLVHEGTPELIIAKSLSPANGWSRNLIEVDTRRWKSYERPSNQSYLRARYAASPAR